jgi:alkanesulfonate monooxygenase SsuD/methylene tetrahydromethanopterin reductase-like flavin-dependent oxidoreductase (luciferase family)
MKFDMFNEIQSPRPWAENHERRVFEEIIEQARAADRMGFETWWQVEHNATPEFSYSSAPDLWMAAVALNTQRMRIGHSGIIARHRVNHPMRAAARTATLDIISNGRLDVGLAVSGAKEWATFGADMDTSAEEYQEMFEMLPRIWTEDDFSWDSPHIRIPRRTLTPKPVQKPHPPLWQTAGSPKSFRAAGRRGVGVLALTILNPVSTMGAMLAEYDAGLAECEKPVGHFANRQKAVFTFVHVAESRKKAIQNGAAKAALWYVVQGPRNFETPLRAYFALFGGGVNPRSTSSDEYKSPNPDPSHDPTILAPEPGDNAMVAIVKRMARGDDISNEEAHEILEQVDSVIIGDPDECLAKFRKYEAIATDRMMCMMQFGHIPHSEVLRSIALAGEHHIPAFAAARPAQLEAIGGGH